MTETAELLPAVAMIDAPSEPPVMISDSAQVLAVITRAATDPAVDIDKLERLMKLYNEREEARAEREFNTALMEVQKEMPRIKRDEENTQTSSMYATLPTVNAALIPIYTRHGFALSFGTGKTDVPDTVLVTCRVSHIGGHKRDYEYPSPLTLTGIKGTTMMTRAHGSGSALSYGRRYLTLMIFNATMTDEDDDGNAATPKEPDEPLPKIGPKRMRQIVDGLLETTKNNDGPGLLQIVNELENDEREVVWRELRSWERSSIKKLLAEAQAADCGVNLIGWASQVLASCKDGKALKAAWDSIQNAYAENGVNEVPLDVNTLYQDRKKELKA